MDLAILFQTITQHRMVLVLKNKITPGLNQKRHLLGSETTQTVVGADSLQNISEKDEK